MATVNLTTRTEKNFGIPPTNVPLSFQEMDSNFSMIETAINANDAALVQLQSDVLSNQNLAALTQRVANNERSVFNIRNTETSLVARVSNSGTSIRNDIQVGFGGALEFFGGQNINLSVSGNRVLINSIFRVAGEPDQNLFGISQVNFTNDRALGLDNLLAQNPLTNLQIRVVNFSSPTNSAFQFIDRGTGEPITLSFPFNTSSGQRNLASANINSTGQIEVVVPRPRIQDGEFSQRNLTNNLFDKLNGIAFGATRTILRNDLSSTETNTGLASNQGRVLNESIATLRTQTETRLADIESRVFPFGDDFVDDFFAGTTIFHDDPADDSRVFSVGEAKRVLNRLQINPTLSGLDINPFNAIGSPVTGLGAIGNNLSGVTNVNWTIPAIGAGSFDEYRVFVYTGNVAINDAQNPPAGAVFSTTISNINQTTYQFTGVNNQQYTIAVISVFSGGGINQHVGRLLYTVNFVPSVPGVSDLQAVSSVSTVRDVFNSDTTTTWNAPTVPNGATFVSYTASIRLASTNGMVTDTNGATLTDITINNINTTTVNFNDVPLNDSYTIRVTSNYTVGATPINQESATSLIVSNKSSFSPTAPFNVPISTIGNVSVTATAWNVIQVQFDGLFNDITSFDVLSNGLPVGSSVNYVGSNIYNFTRTSNNFEASTNFGSIGIRINYMYEGTAQSITETYSIAGRLTFEQGLNFPLVNASTFTPTTDRTEPNLGTLRLDVSGIPAPFETNGGPLNDVSIYVSTFNIQSVLGITSANLHTLSLGQTQQVPFITRHRNNNFLPSGATVPLERVYTSTLTKGVTSIFTGDNIVDEYHAVNDTLDIRLSNEAVTYFIYIVARYTHPSSGATIRLPAPTFSYSHNATANANSFSINLPLRDINNTFLASLTTGTQTNGNNLDEIEVESATVVPATNALYVELINDPNPFDPIQGFGPNDIPIPDPNDFPDTLGITIEQQAINNIFNRYNDPNTPEYDISNSLRIDSLINSDSSSGQLFVATRDFVTESVVPNIVNNTLTVGTATENNIRRIGIQRRSVPLGNSFNSLLQVTNLDEDFIQYRTDVAGTIYAANELQTTIINGRITLQPLLNYSYPQDIVIQWGRSQYNISEVNAERTRIDFIFSQLGATTLTLSINHQLGAGSSSVNGSRTLERITSNQNVRAIYDFLVNAEPSISFIRNQSTEALFQSNGFTFGPATSPISISVRVIDSSVENIFLTANETDTSFLRDSTFVHGSVYDTIF